MYNLNWCFSFSLLSWISRKQCTTQDTLQSTEYIWHKMQHHQTYWLKLLNQYKLMGRGCQGCPTKEARKSFNPCNQNWPRWWTKLTFLSPCTETGYLFLSPLEDELSAASLNEVTLKFKWIWPPFSVKSFPYDLVTSAQSTIPVCGDQRPRVPYNQSISNITISKLKCQSSFILVTNSEQWIQ